nr:MAG TPA: hypothetical protein [Caudoviricetes sp.]
MQLRDKYNFIAHSVCTKRRTLLKIKFVIQRLVEVISEIIVFLLVMEPCTNIGKYN